MNQPIKMILAVDLNNVIGFAGINELQWYLPEDLKNFKILTNHNSVIMGFSTYSSLRRMLPNRTHFVISRENFDSLPPQSVDFYPCRSIEEALQKAQKLGTEIFIIGGAQVYNYCLERGLIDEIYLTRVYMELRGQNLSVVDLSRLTTDFMQTRFNPGENGSCSFLHYTRVQQLCQL